MLWFLGKPFTKIKVFLFVTDFVINHEWEISNEKSYDLSKKFYVEWDDFYWTVHNEQTGENPGQSYVQVA